MSSDSPFLKTVLAIAVLAGAYFITGRLGLLLAIPPGYATAIWPPSGITLAAVLVLGYRVWPGILLGSFLVNLGVTLEAGGSDLIRSAALAAGIGIGAALQGLFGAFLIRRLVVFPARLDHEREVAAFLGLGGPVSCLVNATWSVTLLHLVGSITPENILFTWWTWWVGDTIGVLTITPLVLVWLTPEPWIWRRRRLILSLPLGVTFALALTFFLHASRWEQERIRGEFFRQADAVTAALQQHIDRSLDVLHAIRDFRLATPAFGGEGFRAFVTGPLEHNPGILALSWNPLVEGSQRRIVEARLSTRDSGNARIREFDAAGHLVTAGDRDEYVVVKYIEPHEQNETVIGYDVRSDPSRREALEQARDTGKAVATTPIRLAQANNAPGMLVFMPVYRHGAAPVSEAERRGRIEGYVVGVFQTPLLVNAALAGLNTAKMTIDVKDGETSLYSARGSEGAAVDGDMTRVAPIAVAGRQWQIAATPTAAYMTEHRSWQAWWVLVAGLMFSSLLGAFLLVVTGRAGKVEMLVEERTRELANSNRLLREEIARRTASEQALQDKNVELAAANRAKDSFLATMSHELRTPLNAILGFAGTLLMELAGPLNPEQKSQLRIVEGSAHHLLSLINDLLDLTLIESGRLELRPETLSPSEVVEKVTATLRPLADKKELDLDMRLPEKETPLYTDRRALSQIVINLISNAIKFSDSGQVMVEVKQQRPPAGPGVTAIRVSDTGCGIRTEDRSRLFQAFTQLDASLSRRHEGAGLGLHLSARLAGLLGGKISCESEWGKGSVFTLELPQGVPARETANNDSDSLIDRS